MTQQSRGSARERSSSTTIVAQPVRHPNWPCEGTCQRTRPSRPRQQRADYENLTSTFYTLEFEPDRQCTGGATSTGSDHAAGLLDCRTVGPSSAVRTGAHRTLLHAGGGLDLERLGMAGRSTHRPQRPHDVVPMQCIGWCQRLSARLAESGPPTSTPRSLISSGGESWASSSPPSTRGS